ncbi:carboxymuconolactone decarboxylase family protein [Pseudomonas sp. BN414]|uniref:carboxymuconolactone decarboxylase family protein n=1 Tax=unclassified Pseudomonas TaxID=196821 RepID=UPI0024583F61|nr:MULTISPECIES: carboxymuconolactone decarboxylase family protein [unclassified Pseudomonas]MDH4566264.1 carboxymuconolactone decarboxylase family protein [Pseudomonas sp. BN414]MDH4581952.1 carboxymuconolactone decarboxylase family protein [Pseudomonas sp. BN415]
MLTLEEIGTYVEDFLESQVDGEPLSDRDAALIGLAVRISPSALDMQGTQDYVRRALDAGASAAQVHEVLVLVSGLGVHTLMVGSSTVAAVLRERGDLSISAPLDSLRQQLWDQYVGDDPFWGSMEQQVPGFLDALLRQSPEAFEAFFKYCAVPWKTAALRAYLKELISLAVDAAPSHRFMPGLRLHLANAVQLGVGRKAILQALAIAADAPLHRGIA